MKTLNLILAESALEIVPSSIRGHPSIIRYSKKTGKSPSRTLLDRSYHHPAMRFIRKAWKRGRPDIVHFCLLEALDSPLNREGLLRVYVHTVGDHLIYIASETRLPRNYLRFVGLMEQLFELGRVPPKGKRLLELKRGSLDRLIDEINPSYVVAFSRSGKPSTLRNVMSKISSSECPAVIIGAFPAGSFEDSTLKLADDVISIDPETLNAWTVTSRVIYEYEVSVGLPEKRVRHAGSVSSASQK
ncbi:16S rRNA methyltransferase [Candidatus Bathyarchaeota archaeon]|nr:MAG: 16S rRNA methyltransferase [Candidatus Bathyarchaeota archaeon]